MEEELIEVEGNELFLGDQHLKIDSSNLTTKDEGKEIPVVDDEEIPEVNSEDLLEVDESELESKEDDSEDKFETTSKDTEDDEVSNEDRESTEEQEEALNSFSAFGSLLQEKGFFPDLDEETILGIEDEEGLSELLAKQLNTTFKQEINKYKQNLVQNLVAEGYVSKDQVSDKLPQSFTEEDIKNDIDTAKAAIRKYYKRVGTPDNIIDKTISSMEDIEESAIELNRLNKDLDAKEQNSLAEKLREQEERAIAEREQFAETLKNNTFEYDEFIPGRKLRARDKEEAFNNIEPTLKKINSDLAKYGPMLSYLDKYGMLDGKFDKLIKEGASKQVSKFSKILSEKPRKKGASSKTSSGVIDIDSGGYSIYK